MTRARGANEWLGAREERPGEEQIDGRGSGRSAPERIERMAAGSGGAPPEALIGAGGGWQVGGRRGVSGGLAGDEPVEHLEDQAGATEVEGEQGDQSYARAGEAEQIFHGILRDGFELGHHQFRDHLNTYQSGNQKNVDPWQFLTPMHPTSP